MTAPGEVWDLFGYRRTVLIVGYGCVTYREWSGDMPFAETLRAAIDAARKA